MRGTRFPLFEENSKLASEICASFLRKHRLGKSFPEKKIKNPFCFLYSHERCQSFTAIVGRVPFAIKGKSYFSFILQVPTKDWTKRDFFNEPCEHGEVKNPTSPYMHLKKPERFCGANVFETSVLAHEVELAAADCLQSAYVLSKATRRRHASPRIPLPDKLQF